MTERSVMNLPPVVSATEWQAARDALLAKEKEATRARDALAAERRRLPMVRIDKDYTFDGRDGKATLLDLFEGCRQLLQEAYGLDNPLVLVVRERLQRRLRCLSRDPATRRLPGRRDVRAQRLPSTATASFAPTSRRLAASRRSAA